MEGPVLQRLTCLRFVPSPHARRRIMLYEVKYTDEIEEVETGSTTSSTTTRDETAGFVTIAAPIGQMSIPNLLEQTGRTALEPETGPTGFAARFSEDWKRLIKVTTRLQQADCKDDLASAAFLLRNLLKRHTGFRSSDAIIKKVQQIVHMLDDYPHRCYENETRVYCYNPFVNADFDEVRDYLEYTIRVLTIAVCLYCTDN